MNKGERALALMSGQGGLIAQRGSAFGIYPGGNRRRRPRLQLSAAEVRELEAAGAIARSVAGGAYEITAAGRARVKRANTEAGYQTQHGAWIARGVIDAEGDERTVLALDSGVAMRRLAALRDTRGRPWLSAAELSAAAHLRADWEASQAGLLRGSDWTAPPNASSGRGQSSAQEAALAARCDARRRTAQALACLSAPLRRVVERVCLMEEGLEALERAEGWPGRSGKLALKLGLSQLAASL
jgi:Domain of unknown function (DUF6456)